MPEPWEKPIAAQGNPWDKPAPEIPASKGEVLPPAPMGDLVAQPQTGSNWFENAENDLMHGGSRTLVGKGLGFMQGRGDKGYTGLEAGVSPSAAEFMGSVPMGLAQIGKGTSQVTEGHPLSGTGNMIGGAAKAATIPSMFAGGPMAESAIEAIPSRVHAGKVLDEISGLAKDVPLQPENVWPPLERYQELTKAGGSTAKPATQLSTRLQNLVRMPEKGMLNFPEGRDFYSNISSQSAEEASRLNPIMRRQMGQVRQGLHQDLTNAAGTVGKGQDYADAIKEYAQASKMRDLVGKTAKVALPTAGLGLLGELAYNKYFRK